MTLSALRDSVTDILRPAGFLSLQAGTVVAAINNIYAQIQDMEYWEVARIEETFTWTTAFGVVVDTGSDVSLTNYQGVIDTIKGASDTYYWAERSVPEVLNRRIAPIRERYNLARVYGIDGIKLQIAKALGSDTVVTIIHRREGPALDALTDEPLLPPGHHDVLKYGGAWQLRNWEATRNGRKTMDSGEKFAWDAYQSAIRRALEANRSMRNVIHESVTHPAYANMSQNKIARR